jgi:hypothetical protein
MRVHHRDIAGQRRAAPWPAIVLIAVVGGAALAGCGTRAAPPAATPATVMREFSAYDSTGALTVPVGSTASGSCWESSIAVAATNAYRCFSGNSIEDPCFALSPTATLVACLADPWAKAIVLNLTEALPTASGPGSAQLAPWSLQLASGVRCTVTTGQVPVEAGQAYNFHCTDGADAYLVPSTSADRVAVELDPGAAAARSVAVQTIWQA